MVCLFSEDHDYRGWNGKDVSNGTCERDTPDDFRNGTQSQRHGPFITANLQDSENKPLLPLVSLLEDAAGDPHTNFQLLGDFAPRSSGGV